MTEAIRTALVAGLLTLGVELVRSLAQRRKMSADVAGELTSTAIELVAPLRQELRDARAEADQLRQELHAARVEIANLRGRQPPAGPHAQQ